MSKLNLNKLSDRVFVDGAAEEVRSVLEEHLQAGKSLTAEGYWLLLKTFPTKGKRPPELMQLVDELLAKLDTPSGDKLEAHRDGGSLLEELAERLLAARRWERCFELHERAYERGGKALSYRMHETLLKVAVKLDEKVLRKAFAMHLAMVKKEPGLAFFPAIKRASAKAKAALDALGEQLPTAPDTKAELAARIQELAAAGGAVGYDGQHYAKPRPIGAKRLATMTLGKKALPPTLAQWLAFDASWLPLFAHEGGFAIITLEAFFVRYAEDNGLSAAAGKEFARQQEHKLKAKTKVIELPASATQNKLLILDIVDAAGEMPVFSVEKEQAVPSYDTFGDFVLEYMHPRGSKPAAKRAKKPATKKATRKKR